MKHRKLDVLATKGRYIWKLRNCLSSAINAIAPAIEFLLQILKLIPIFFWKPLYKKPVCLANGNNPFSQSLWIKIMEISCLIQH